MRSPVEVEDVVPRSLRPSLERSTPGRPGLNTMHLPVLLVSPKHTKEFVIEENQSKRGFGSNKSSVH